MPSGHHPATPRFLLSLLATAVYLSVPSTASQALNLILSSVGPHTAVRYLNFAIGKPIESPSDIEPVAAVGLEKLAEEVTYATSAASIRHSQQSESESEISQKLHDLNIKKEDPSASLTDYSEIGYHDVGHEPFFHYGAVSDKIGEAAACWLARWGLDIFAYERLGKDVSASIVGSRPNSLPSCVKDNPSNHVIPVVWRRGGLNPKWVRALVSSDALFVKGERERYEFAKSVVDIRRQCGIDKEEEDEWTRLFTNGIYFAHMVCLSSVYFSRLTPSSSHSTISS